MLVVRRWVRDAGDPVNTYRKVLRLLTPRERKRGALVLGMVVIMALLETAGVASVAPFLSVLGNPSMVETNPILSRLYTGLGFASTDSFLMLLGAGALALVGLLVVTDPWLALVVGVAVAGMYGLVFFGVKGLLDRIGRDRVAANRERFMAAGEALGGIKDIKLLGREQAYLSRFRPSSIRFARHQATNQTISEVPKSLIEAVAIGGVLALALFLMATRDGVGEILPMLGLYAFAGYRLLPAAQRIYAGISNMRFGAAAVDSVYEDLRYRTSLAEIHRPAPHPLLPQREIRLHDVSFAYPHASAPALRNIDTAVPVGTSVGLAGGTGAGRGPWAMCPKRSFSPTPL